MFIFLLDFEYFYLANASASEGAQVSLSHHFENETILNGMQLWVKADLKQGATAMRLILRFEGYFQLH